MLTQTEQRQHEKLTRELGPVVIKALQDPLTIEVMLNPDGQLWVERLGEEMQRIGTLPASAAEAAMGTIAACLQTTVSRENPILEGELPLDGSRFEGLIPPVVAQPTFAIRKKASQVFSLEQYLEAGSISKEQYQRICAAVGARQNILVVGGTSSGKTTLSNAIIKKMDELSPDLRLVIIEDTGEIQCSADNAVIMRATAYVSMLQLLRATLRLRPDRILVGEVRGGEALSLLKMWNTGHPGGLATLHANNARAGLTRLEQLVSEATSAPMQHLISEAVDLVIHIAKTANGRKVTGLLEVQDFRNGEYVTEEICPMTPRSHLNEGSKTHELA
nr:P-type conjugative transfer ATPase TrbB [Pseudomonas furukawaii]